MLSEQLIKYTEQDIYPFHMPGHKRRKMDSWNPYEIDITEIDGFDNLHQAREILLEVQKKASSVYGSKECYYLVNGSTCGILAAISAAVHKAGKILVARNCHKSVYNGMFLRELDVVYAYPEPTRMGIQGQIHAEQIEELLKENPDIEAVLITSPTYDGVVSNIKAIAEVVHQHQLPLIVDAAHGAHLGFVEGFPENPITQGADVVIESVHKTLPAFTQTALLHICSNRIPAEKIRKYLGIYETSSPSYLLMAGIDRCVTYLEQDGKKALLELKQQLLAFYKRASHLQNIKVLQRSDLSMEEAYDYDFSKIVIFSKDESVSGKDMHKVLLDKYHLQMEMVSKQYVLALCSVMDTAEGFGRLIEALEEIDKSELFRRKDVSEEWQFTDATIYRKQRQLLPIHKVEDENTEVVFLQQAIGKAAGEYLYLYPPGIPIIVPGEEITEEFVVDIVKYQEAGLTIEGLAGENRICIVNFS